MPISRRKILGVLAGASLLPRLFGKPLPFEVDRLLEEIPQAQTMRSRRRYRANATITLLSIPIVSKADVGSGYIAIQQSAGIVGDGAGADASTTGIQFGAGSWPEAARGLNRLGYIQEAVVGTRAGQLTECAYFAFMTTSQEKNLDQAKKALQSPTGTVPYTAAEGVGRAGRFSSRLSRVSFPSQLTWRDCPVLVDRVRAAVSNEAAPQTVEKTLGPNEAAPATFLYAVRQAILDANATTRGSLIYNGKEFGLRTVKSPDASVKTGRVMRLDATLHETATGRETTFKVWYEAGSEHLPPLRFEYQARPFLRLTFEYNPEYDPNVKQDAKEKETA